MEAATLTVFVDSGWNALLFMKEVLLSAAAFVYKTGIG